MAPDDRPTSRFVAGHPTDSYSLPTGGAWWCSGLVRTWGEAGWVFFYVSVCGHLVGTDCKAVEHMDTMYL